MVGYYGGNDASSQPSSSPLPSPSPPLDEVSRRVRKLPLELRMLIQKQLETLEKESTALAKGLQNLAFHAKPESSVFQMGSQKVYIRTKIENHMLLEDSLHVEAFTLAPEDGLRFVLNIHMKYPSITPVSMSVLRPESKKLLRDILYVYFYGIEYKQTKEYPKKIQQISTSWGIPMTTASGTPTALVRTEGVFDQRPNVSLTLAESHGKHADYTVYGSMSEQMQKLLEGLLGKLFQMSVGGTAVDVPPEDAEVALFYNQMIAYKKQTTRRRTRARTGRREEYGL